MSVLLAVWRLLDKRQRRQLAGLQLLSIAMGLSTVGGVAAVLPFFTALVDPNAARHNDVLRAVLQRITIADDSLLVMVLGAAFAAIVLVANAVNLFGFLAINRFAFRVGDTLYVRLFDEYMQRDYLFHTRNHSSVLATKVLHETARVTYGILQQGLILVTNVVTIICVATSMLLVSPVAAAGTIAGLGVSYAAVYAFARGRLLRNGRIESRCDATRTRTVNESFGAIREITLLQARDSFVKRFAEQCRLISQAACNTMAISSSPRYILECITVSCLVGVALYLHAHTGADGAWIAQLSFVGFAAYRLLPALQQSFSAIVRIRANHPAFDGIQTDLERAQRPPGSTRIAVLDRGWRGRPRSEIRLCEVSFRYAADLPEAVSGVSLVFPASKVIGLMGPNGSGKSTLLDLVCGLLSPQSGHIEVDGIRLEQGNCVAWQATIAYVPQQVFLCDATVAENIAFGVSVAQIDKERLEAAVRLARLTECIANLPNGYAELLGERGCRLSGGQRQRVAIARALYRGASLLILDEATSSLDPAAEDEVLETLIALRPEKTILLSAHRVAALRQCDLLFELRNGKVVGTGRAGQTAPVKTPAVSVF
jgi:ABC-type multidrug transport system fused ATPase/permease subunit